MNLRYNFKYNHLTAINNGGVHTLKYLSTKPNAWTEGDANERAYQYFNEHYGVTETSGGSTRLSWNLGRGNIRNTEWWEYGLTVTPYWYLVPLFNLK